MRGGCIPSLSSREGTLLIILFYIIWITISFLLNFLKKAAVFVFFFLAEYASIVLISILRSILFPTTQSYYSRSTDGVGGQALGGGGYLLPFSLFTSIGNPILEGLIYGLLLGFKTCIIIFG
jgi:hypothetical protein